MFGTNIDWFGKKKTFFCFKIINRSPTANCLYRPGAILMIVVIFFYDKKHDLSHRLMILTYFGSQITTFIDFHDAYIARKCYLCQLECFEMII